MVYLTSIDQRNLLKSMAWLKGGVLGRGEGFVGVAGAFQGPRSTRGFLIVAVDYHVDRVFRHSLCELWQESSEKTCRKCSQPRDLQRDLPMLDEFLAECSVLNGVDRQLDAVCCAKEMAAGFPLFFRARR